MRPCSKARSIRKGEYVGQTVAVDTVELRARVQAFLIRRAFKEGDDVKQGALLFVLEREPFEAAVDAAAARSRRRAPR